MKKDTKKVLKPRTVAEFVTHTRVLRGWTMALAAQSLRVTKSYVNLVERGKYNRPTAFLARLMRYLTVVEKRELSLILATELLEELGDESNALLKELKKELNESAT